MNPVINWHDYSLSLECGGEAVCILGTKYSCSNANIEVFALKLVLRIICSNKVSAWLGVLRLKTTYLLFRPTFGTVGA